ncbi:MAG: phage holin family protein [Burkholderiales bacterium]|nr:phage holin family protein [Anaerolineae bacterium]
MRGFFVRLVINAVAIFLTVRVLDALTLSGVSIEGGDTNIGTLLVISLVISILNALLKPLLKLLSCAFILLTFGLFIVVVNAVILWLTAQFTALNFENFWWAILAGIVMGIIATIMEWVLDRVGWDEN